MPIPGLNAAACARRNYVAALRGGVEAAPVRLFTAAAPLVPWEPNHNLRAIGTLPKTDEAALDLINALRVGEAELTLDDLYLHYAEAANDNFIPDRYMFLAESTLKNIGRDAARGVSFMNSHRTGGMSSPTELPFGRSFCGRYEVSPEGKRRALLGMYMLRRNADGEPLRPNGTGGPSTSDLHAMIDAGVLSDVSVGLYGGSERCDVCGNALYDYWHDDEDDEPDKERCNHVPGTTRKLTREQKISQRERGVPEGRASYSLEDAYMGECSGVFDGAVPGAGFRKALALQGQLEGVHLAECRQAYHTLARRRDFTPFTGQLLQNRGAPGAILSGEAGRSDLSDAPDPSDGSDKSDPDPDLCPACGERMTAGEDGAEATCGNADCTATKKKPVDDPDEPDDDGDNSVNSVSAAASAEVAAACPTLSTTEIPTFDPSEPIPAGIPFAIHARQVVSACDRFAARLVSRRETRANQGRPPDKAMLAAAEEAQTGIQAAIDRIDAEVALATPAPTPVSPGAVEQQQLRLRALTTRADVLRLSVE